MAPAAEVATEMSAEMAGTVADAEVEARAEAGGAARERAEPCQPELAELGPACEEEAALDAHSNRRVRGEWSQL